MGGAVAKLRSRRGASLSVALLLFLVCAVVGTVVLTAGTAAAGRLSRLAEMDRRYHSVTSAAELLARELTGTPVTIVRSRTLETVKTRAFTKVVEEIPVEPEPGEEDPEDPEDPGQPQTTTRITFVDAGASTRITATYHTAVNGVSPGDVTAVTTDGTAPASNEGRSLSLSGMSLLTARAAWLLFGGRPCNTDEAMAYSLDRGFGAETPETFTLQHSPPAGIDADALTIQGSSVLKSDGTLVLTLRDPGDDYYAVTVTLRPQISETAQTDNSGSGTPVVTTADNGDYTETVTTASTLTKTSTIQWTLSSIQ